MTETTMPAPPTSPGPAVMSAALIPSIRTFRPSSSAADWSRPWGGSSSELRSPESTAASDSVVVGTGVVSTVGTVAGSGVPVTASSVAEASMAASSVAEALASAEEGSEWEQPASAATGTRRRAAMRKGLIIRVG